MWGLLEAAIPGVASALGVRNQNQQNVQLSREGMAFESDQVRKQMAFQERMSNSSYQRATEDMRLAGINPMLAYAQGGASTPGGGAASGAAATVQDVIGPAVASAQHARMLSEDLKARRGQNAHQFLQNTQIIPREAALLSAQRGQLVASAAAARAAMSESRARIANTNVDTQRRILELPASQRRGATAKILNPVLGAAGRLSEDLFGNPRNYRIPAHELGRGVRRAKSAIGRGFRAATSGGMPWVKSPIPWR